MTEFTKEDKGRLCDFFLILYEADKEQHAKNWPKCPFPKVWSRCTERLGLVRRLCDTLLAIKTCR